MRLIANGDEVAVVQIGMGVEQRCRPGRDTRNGGRHRRRDRLDLVACAQRQDQRCRLRDRLGGEIAGTGQLLDASVGPFDDRQQRVYSGRIEFPGLLAHHPEHILRRMQGGVHRGKAEQPDGSLQRVQGAKRALQQTQVPRIAIEPQQIVGRLLGELGRLDDKLLQQFVHSALLRPPVDDSVLETRYLELVGYPCHGFGVSEANECPWQKCLVQIVDRAGPRDVVEID